MSIRFLSPIIPAEKQRNGRHRAANGQRGVRHVEHGKAERQHLEHVHHITVHEPVDHVAQRAAGHQHHSAARPPAQPVSADDQRACGHQHERQYAQQPRLSAEHAERHAGILRIRQTQQARNQLDRLRPPMRLRFHRLIERDHRQRNPAVSNHNYSSRFCTISTSCARKSPMIGRF